MSAEASQALAAVAPAYFTRGQLAVTVLSTSVDSSGRLVVELTATRNDKPLVVSNPFVVTNPPTRVLQGGVPIDSPLEAFKSIIADAVELTGKQK